MQKNTYTAIITARGGSKGLPRKNVLDLAGKPMVAHTITAALESECFEQVIVTTDCSEIKAVSQKWGADVIDRPAELATDDASSLDVVMHALLELARRNKETTHFVILQPTSPIRDSKHIREAVVQLEETGANSLVSVKKSEHPIQKHLYYRGDEIEPVFSWSDLTKPRQALEDTFLINGAIYIEPVNEFMEEKELFSKPLTSYVMCKTSSIDIDNHDDFVFAENIVSCQ